jgi:hypothetical protein
MDMMVSFLAAMQQGGAYTPAHGMQISDLA